MLWIRKVLIVIILAVLLLPAQNSSAATFTGHNGQIAFGKADGIWTVRQNGSQAQLLSERTASDMAWSPDGTQLAFVEPRSNDTTCLKIINALTGTTRAMTRQSSMSDSEPVWSYDGTRIAFVRTKQVHGSKQSAVFTIKTDGDELKNISGWSVNKSYRVPSWAPDSKRLAYEEITSSSARILTKNFVNGSVRELATLSDISQPPLLAWSPSGKKLLFNDSEGQVYTIWADGTHRTVISDGDSYGASWSPDGNRMAFLEDFSGESISVSEPDGTIRYISLGLSGYDHVDTPVWSPNGQQLVFVASNTSTGTQDLFSVAVAGTSQPHKIASGVTGVVAWQAKK